LSGNCPHSHKGLVGYLIIDDYNSDYVIIITCKW